MKAVWLASVGLMLCGGEAAAQIAPTRSGSSTSSPSTNTRPFQQLQAFGTCLAQTRKKDALALIATAPDSAEEEKVLRKVVFGEQASCLFGGTTMSMPGIFARGAVAEGLLRIGGVPDSYRLPAPAASEVRDLHGAARCYTSGHRADVANLLRSKPGGAEEVKAVAALWDEFRACMPNFKVRLNAPWIRFLLAEALLRTSGPAAPAVAR
jgi:hypothetical protein